MIFLNGLRPHISKFENIDLQEFARGWRAFILVLVDCSKVRPGGGGRKRRKEREEREKKEKGKNVSISVGGHAATQLLNT